MMISRLRDAFGAATTTQAVDVAVAHGMADVLAALDNVIDDDATLRCIYAGRGQNGPGAATVDRAARTAASRRRIALNSVAAVTAALAAGAVAFAAVGVPGAGRGGSQGPAVNTAYVVKRVDSALSAADPGAIAQMTVTTSGAATSGGRTAATTAEEWSYGDRWRAVVYSAGHLHYDEGVGAASADTVVNFQTRTWARRPGPGRPAALSPGARDCKQVIAALPVLLAPGLPAGGLSASSLPATVARDLRAAVSCGTLTAAGRQRVDGIEAIELTSRPASVIPETIWVSPRTYLPVRAVIRPAAGTPGPRQTADITWLAPTAQNVAHLTVPVPAGFRQVEFAQAVTPNMQRIQG
jgi:hypothetical protein